MFNIFSRRYILLIIFVFSLISTLIYFSYQHSEKAAEALIGDSLKYFQLSNSRLSFEPFEGNSIVWMFKFSYPGIYDEEFEIYTSLLGNIKVTIPRNLETYLREAEKTKIHPYSKEGIEIRYHKRRNSGGTIQNSTDQ